MENMLIFAVITIAFAVFFFVFSREVACWYFKVNDRIENQKEIIRLLKKMAGEAPAVSGRMDFELSESTREEATS